MAGIGLLERIGFKKPQAKPAIMPVQRPAVSSAGVEKPKGFSLLTHNETFKPQDLKTRFAGAMESISKANGFGRLVATNTFTDRERTLKVHGHLLEIQDGNGRNRSTSSNPQEGDVLHVLSGVFKEEQAEIARKSPLFKGALSYENITVEGEKPTTLKFRIQNGSLVKIGEQKLTA